MPGNNRIICPHCRAELTNEDSLVNIRSERVGCTRCTTECEECGARIFVSESREVNDNLYCSACTFNCANCGETELTNDGCSLPNGDMICRNCAEENYSHCDNCDEFCHNGAQETTRVYIDDENYHEQYWCQSCIETSNEIRWDDDCETYVLERNTQRGAQMPINRITQEYLDKNEARYRCPVCFKEPEPCADCLERQAKALKKEELTLWVYDTGHCNYHENFHNRFKRLRYRIPHEHPYLYYGIELEVIFSSSANKAKVVEEFIKATNGMFVSEYDRSVDNIGNGAEFISRPMSYKAWTSPKTKELLTKGVEILKEAGATINQNEGCGMHVHMSRIFFEHNTKKSVDEIRSDMDWIFQVFQPQIEKLSRRKYTRFCMAKKDRLQMFNPIISDQQNMNLEIKLKKSNLPSSQEDHENHHYAVVLTKKTIEVRTFQSTLDIDTIIAYIQFCRAIAHASRNMKLTTKTTFGDIIFCKDGDELTDLVHKLKIDVNVKNKNEIEVKQNG